MIQDTCPSAAAALLTIEVQMLLVLFHSLHHYPQNVIVLLDWIVESPSSVMQTLLLQSSQMRSSNTSPDIGAATAGAAMSQAINARKVTAEQEQRLRKAFRCVLAPFVLSATLLVCSCVSRTLSACLWSLTHMP